jgi:DNA-binding NtrC family response regulator
MSHLLIIDDDRTVANGLAFMLENEGYKISVALNRKTAEKILKQEEVDIVVCDLMVPAREDGLSLIRYAKEQNPITQVMVITAYGTIENAVEAVKTGADDFIVKGFDNAELKLKLKRLEEAKAREMDRYKSKLTVEILLEDLEKRGAYDRFVGESRAIKDLVNKIEQVARSNFHCCLVEGETGSGKELVARMIHRLSPRGDKPFIAINCAAMPEQLIESELFGHEKGAFTGADKARHGKFELAQGGTILLDEIGELPFDLQGRLLRILEGEEFFRLGGQKPIDLDIAIIADTNRDLRQAVNEGKFRGDIFHRLNSINLKTPPLRDYVEDVPLLADYFINLFNQTKRTSKVISPDAVDVLKAYHYPGNVRELKNIIENAMTFAQSDVIGVDDLIPSLATLSVKKGPISEVEIIKKVMGKHNGNITHAAKELGYTREGLTRKLKKMGLRQEK